jgi:O-antigen ligase
MPLLLALVLANSRGSLLGFFGQLLLIVLLSKPIRRDTSPVDSEAGGTANFTRVIQTRWFRGIISGALALFLFIGISWIGGDPLINKLEAVSGEVSSVSDPAREGTRRIDIWHATWQMIAEKPIAGVGFGGYSTAIPRYHVASGKLIPQEAHNDYLEILASGGIIGAGIVLWFLIAFLRRLRQQLRSITSQGQRAICVGALAGIFAVAIHSLVDFGLHITINALVCVALFVVALLSATPERVDKTTLSVRPESLKNSGRRGIRSNI